MPMRVILVHRVGRVPLLSLLRREIDGLMDLDETIDIRVLQIR